MRTSTKHYCRYDWCSGAESDRLRNALQAFALPVSYTEHMARAAGVEPAFSAGQAYVIHRYTMPHMVDSASLELATSRLSGGCSILLSYGSDA